MSEAIRLTRRGLLASGTLAMLGERSAIALAEGNSLTVAAASDLQGLFTELGPLFERRTGTRAQFSFGSSGSLARQIENGAPFDLFFAANEQFVADLERKGKIVPGSRRHYATGVLVLASSRRAGVEVKGLKGLLDPRIKRVTLAHPDHAPYGFAAREALMKVGIWEALRPKLVLAENVRQAFQFVSTGNAEAGLLARSVSSGAHLWARPVDSKLYTPIRQAGGLVTGRPIETQALKFLRTVLGEDGRRLLTKHGLNPPPKPPGTGPKRK